MSKLSFLLIFLLLALSCAQKNKDIDLWIKSIFNVSISTTPTQPPQSNAYKSCGLEKECVPYFLCLDGEVNIYGENVIDIRIDGRNEDQCHYLESCCNTNRKKSDAVIITNPRTEQTGCGYRNSDGVGFRLIGDQNNEAQFGEFPWMVAILKYVPSGEKDDRLYLCGGSLIAPTVILTAAHCVDKRNANSIFIRAGEWDSKSNLEVLPHQDRLVREIILHESFKPGSLHNDIAILIVESAFEFADNIRPICLPPTDMTFDNSRCYANGWGKNKFAKEGVYQVILKKVDLPIVPRSTCLTNLRNTRLGRHFQLHESFICAGGEKDKDTCEGDGGSPLVCPIEGQNDRFYQTGIVSWGIGCGNESIPGVYTNVPHLRRWINDKMMQKGLDMSYSTP